MADVCQHSKTLKIVFKITYKLGLLTLIFIHTQTHTIFTVDLVIQMFSYHYPGCRTGEIAQWLRTLTAFQRTWA